MPKASQRLMKRAALSAESFSRMPAELTRLVGHDPDGTAAHPCEAGDDRAREAGLDVEHEAVVDDPADHVVHVVGLAGRVGEDVQQLLVGAVDGVGGLAPRRGLLAVLGEEGQVVLDRLDALLVGLDLEVPHAGDLGVDLRAAEVLLRDVLASDGARQVRAGQRHRAATLDHRHEVGEPWDVCGARGARPHQGRDLRDHAAHDHLLPEQVARAGEQRAGGLLDPRPGGVQQPDERDPLAERQLAQTADLELAGHPHRAGHDREVVGAHRHQPPVDLAVAGDHTVRRSLAAFHRSLGEVRAPVHPQLGERAVVDQQRQTLARGELVLCVLTIDFLLPPAEPGALAASVQIVDQRAQRRPGHQCVLRDWRGSPVLSGRHGPPPGSLRAAALWRASPTRRQLGAPTRRRERGTR